MKKTIKHLLGFFMAAVAAVSCVKSTEYDNIDSKAPGALLYPSDGVTLEIFKYEGASTNFEWKSSEGTQMYSVIFYAADGKTQVGEFLADNHGENNTCGVDHVSLSEVADKAGIKAGEEGLVYWNVAAVSGGSQMLASKANKLTIRRFASTLDIPANLYITGEGSEYGTDLAAAKPLRKMGAGQFEIFTKLNGEFTFTNRNAEGDRQVYGITEEGIVYEGKDAVATAEEGVYQVYVDFRTGKVNLKKVEKLTYHWCWTPDENAELDYIGDGKWSRRITPPTGDNRYRFDAVMDGAKYIYGSPAYDTPNAPVEMTGSQYNISMRGDDNNQWSWAFKFPDSVKGVELTVVVDCSSEVPHYYHYYEFDFPLVAIPVSLVAPAEGDIIRLSSIAGSTATFSWNKVADSEPSAKVTTYSLILYSDAQGQNVLTTFAAGKDGEYAISHSDLEAIAAKAGIEDEGEGEMYWAVESKLVDKTALSDIRKVKVARLQGIPKAMYFSGEASEFGNSYKALRKTETGKFEIYTHLNKGALTIATSESDDARHFKLNVTGYNNNAWTANIEESVTDGSWNGDANGDAAEYRIRLDFTSMKATLERINWVYFEHPFQGNKGNFQYSGNGVYILDNLTVNPDPNWESRFRIKAWIGNHWECWGNESGRDAPEPDEATDNYMAYKAIYVHPSSDDAWEYIIKNLWPFDAVLVTLDMSPDSEHYNLKINKK